MKKALKLLGGLATFLVVVVSSFLSFWPAVGGDLDGERLQRAQSSIHRQHDKFFNTIPQPSTGLKQSIDYLFRQFTGEEQRYPPTEIPVLALPESVFDGKVAPGLRAIWLGHASVYLELGELRILTDPVFSEYSSPVQLLGPKRFHPPPLALEKLPRIDAVVISHDHYDHLDMATIQALARTGTQFYLPLGAGAHLDRWGVGRKQITELDWGESATLGNVQFVSTPARHYSGRGLLNHKDTFWTSWSLISTEHRVFYSGDTGYTDHFDQIGQNYGPFDLSLIKIGAYGPGPGWLAVHMSAKDAVRAHIDLGATRMLPVHWGTFNLGFHDWDEPVRIALKASRQLGAEMVTPRIGEMVFAGRPFDSTEWWSAVHEERQDQQ